MTGPDVHFNLFYFCTIAIACFTLNCEATLDQVHPEQTSNNKSEVLTHMSTFPAATFVSLQFSLPPSLRVVMGPCITFVPGREDQAI